MWNDLDVLVRARSANIGHQLNINSEGTLSKRILITGSLLIVITKDGALDLHRKNLKRKDYHSRP